ncbi:Crp/Fnr family transcriptional regulator [Paenibacillus barcinonensis]|uniref:CRP/FNR family transcriptional regulator n=1 Tax=Paenibacillus barcinonensis TaxID=198119 RepID=A0A2V4VDV5_PAEBA|nr:Crp/Fnr family transcriptional regulator [Paenibacillus barcinonensis]PYE51234.1 CRP/FNR family transcriptional regulator [Paenibacillus barcinonensis]QKS55641.1 Crp/Fnr family transcriptional regulator [Paenibacillus barcinonensis]
MICSQTSDEFCFSKVPLFEHLSPYEGSLLNSLLHTSHYHKGELVVQEGECSDTLYILQLGSVKLCKYNEAGKEHIIRFLFAGDFFGQDCLLHQIPHPSNAVVLENSTICSIRQKEFELLLTHAPKLAYYFLLALSHRLRETEEWNSSINAMTTEQKIAKLLLDFHMRNHAKPELRLPVFKKDMALLLGITPETLSRKLNSMQRQQLLQVNGNDIRILQLERLQHMIS